MILLELHGNKQLKVKNKHKIFVGENNFDSINIQLVDNQICDYNVSDCEFTAHVVFPDQTYIEYELEWDEASSTDIPISKDLTSEEQKLELFIEIKADNNVLGYTNAIEITVEHIVNEALRIVTRDELIEIITNILTGKLDSIDGAVKTANIADGAVKTSKIYNSAVTSAKLADNSVTESKLSVGLQDAIDLIPETPLFVSIENTLSTAGTFDTGDYCIAGAFYQFDISGALAQEVGINVEQGASKPCEMRFVNSYQVITQTDTQQVFSREVSRVAPSFNADNWAEISR